MKRNENSWFSGFTQKIRDSIAPTLVEENAARLSKEEQHQVNAFYSRINDKLNSECFYCGTMLIDSLDNDIALDEEDDDEKFRIAMMYEE